LVDVALPAPTGGSLAVWFGAAGGGLDPADTLTVDDGANSVTGTDFNRDGRPDLATSSVITDRVLVALGSAAAALPAGPGDANCDGRFDSMDLGALAARLFADGCSGADANGDTGVTAADLPRTVRLVSQLK